MDARNWVAAFGSGPGPRRRVAWLGGGLIVVIVGLAAFDLVRAYRATVDETKLGLETQSRVIAEQTARSVQAVDVILRHVADEYRRGRLARLDADELHVYLRDVTAGLEQIDGLGMFDARGDPLAVSWPARTARNMAHLPRFQQLRDDRKAGFVIFDVARGVDDGAWIVPFARRLETASGEFAGVVAARGRVAYFEQFYRDTYPDPSARVALLHRNTTLLARHPGTAESLGRRFPALEALLPAPGGRPVASRGSSPVDGVDRFASIRLVPDYPLVVVVTRDAAAALAPWRSQATGSVLRTLALATLAALLLAVVLRQLARLDAARRSLEVSQERYALAAAGSDDGIWDWDLQAGTAYESRRARELQGLPLQPETQPIGELKASLTYHRGDAHQRASAMQAHLDGDTPAYEVDYRVLRDGEYRWIHVRALCIRDAAGKPVRLAGSVTDIDGRKRAEVALRESEERYALAMAGSNEGHWLWNMPARQIYVSAKLAELFGFAGGAQVMVDSDYFARLPLHPEDRERVHRNRNDHVAGLTPRLDHEFRIVVPATGEVRWVHTRAQCFRDADGEPVRMAGSTVDATERKRTEEALRESEERFAVAVAGSDDGIWVWDYVAGTAYASQRAREIFGLSDWPELQSIDDWSARMERRLEPADIERRRAAIAAHVSGATPAYEFEYRVRTPQGNRWVRARGMCVRDHDGRPLRFAGSVSDIDVRKRGEDALRQSEERYALAMTGSRGGHWVWDAATDVFFVSGTANELFGLPADRPHTTRAAFRQRVPVHPDDAERVQTILDDLTAGRIERADYEYRVRLPDGERWILTRSQRFQEADGSGLRVAGVSVDVTDRKRTEEALRRSEERYQLAVAGSNEGLWDWDIASDLLFLSPRAQQLVFAEATEPATRPRGEWQARTTNHPDDTAAVRLALSAHLRGQTPHFSVEYRVRHHSGEWRWYRQRGIAVRDAAGRAYRMAGSMEDISVRKNAEGQRERLERQLRQAQKLEAIGTLAGGIAHDFNNILSAILGYGEMVQKDVGDGTTARRHIDAAMSAGLRAKSLVERILAFSRGGTAERVTVPVQAVVAEALDGVAATLPAGVRVERRLAAPEAGVAGDATQIHQVVMNLCANAVHAMRSGGVLTVSVEALTLRAPLAVATSTLPAGAYACVRVADTGSGIEPQVLDRIFDPFFTTKEVGVGTGLGLSLVHGIVTDLGGGIAVDSTAGQGTTFGVYLPWQRYEAPMAASEEAIAPGEGQTVLLVDDEEALVRLGEETLAELGYEPIGFTSAQHALEAFRATPERFDAVLTDEAMPGMAGSELAAEIRRLRPDVPVVLMTGFVNPAIAARARDAGVADVLVKPLGSRDIARCLAAVFEREKAGVAAEAT